MWDAAEYDAVADVQERWGRAVLDRNEWRGDETVLDAGCGSGRLLAPLAEKIPQGRLYCLDANAEMIERLRQRRRELGLALPIEILHADMAHLEGAPLRPASLDVIFSNAALHWVEDKQRTFAGFRRLLRPGGRLTVQCGGEGNIQRISAAGYRAARDAGLPTATVPVHFQSAEATREQLKIRGFREVRVWQEDSPAEFPDRDSFLRFCTAVVFRSLQVQASGDQFERFLAEFAPRAYALLGGWRIDYVRQNIEARR